MHEQDDPETSQAALQEAVTQELMVEATLSLENSNYEKALEIYELILERDGGNIEARRALIRLLIDKERTDEAVSSLKKLVELTPNDASVRWSLGRQCHKSGRFEQAIRSYTDAIEILPERGLHYFLRAQSFKAVGRNSEALSDLQSALELEPNKIEYLDDFIRMAKGCHEWRTIIAAVRALAFKGVDDLRLRLLLIDALFCEGLVKDALHENRLLLCEDSVLLDVGVNFIKLGAFREARDCLKQGLAAAPRPAAHGYLNWLHVCSLHLDEAEALNNYLGDLLGSNPQTFINASEFSSDFLPFIQTRKQKRDAGPVLLNTMPKSGSVYIWRQLSNLLEMPMARVSKTNWPVDDIIPSWVEAFACSQTIAQGHFHPSSDNVDCLIKNGLRKMVFHVRDPRQATISWTHHVQSYIERGLKNQFWPSLPHSYEAWGFDRQLSWNIENHLPALCRWIIQWDKVFAREGFKVLYCTYENFKENEFIYFKNLMEFLSSDAGVFEYQQPETIRGCLHFRVGKTNEWENIFSDQQKALALSFMPIELMKRFSWKEM